MEKRDLQKDLRLERNFAADPETERCPSTDAPNENEKISTKKGENVLSDSGGVAREEGKGGSGGEKGVGSGANALNEIAARVQVRLPIFNPTINTSRISFFLAQKRALSL